MREIGVLYEPSISLPHDENIPTKSQINIKRPRQTDSEEVEEIRNKLLKTHPDILSGKI